MCLKLFSKRQNNDNTSIKRKIKGNKKENLQLQSQSERSSNLKNILQFIKNIFFKYY